MVQELLGSDVDSPISDLESMTVSCMILDRQAARWGVENLSAEHFTAKRFKVLFQAIRSLVLKHVEVDLPILHATLDRKDQLQWVGGREGLIWVAEQAVGGNAARSLYRQYGRDLVEAYARREIVRRCEAAIRDAENHELSIDDLVSKAQSITHRLVSVGSDTYHSSQFDPMGKSLLKGITTGLPCIDRHVGTEGVGFPKCTVSMVGGKRGGGKTGFMVNSMIQAIREGQKVAYATLEMNGDAVSRRMVQSLSGWDICPDIDGLAAGYLAAVEQVKAWNVPMWDPSGKLGSEKTIQALTTWATDLTEAKGLDALYVDYFQLLDAKGRFDNRTRTLDFIADELLRLGQTMKISVIAGSQLSKDADGQFRAKDSIKLEDNAELVLYLQKEKLPPGSLRCDATVTIGKNRNGRETAEEAVFFSRHVRYEDPNPGKHKKRESKVAENLEAFGDYDPFFDTP